MRDSEGFTLIEVIVVMSVLLIIMSIVCACIVAGTEFAGKGRNRIRTQQTAELMVADLRAELGEARLMRVDDDGYAVTGTNPQYSVYYRFDRNAGDLLKTYSERAYRSGPQRVNPRDMAVIDCAFTDTGDSVRISLVLQHRFYSGTDDLMYRAYTGVHLGNR